MQSRHRFATYCLVGLGLVCVWGGENCYGQASANAPLDHGQGNGFFTDPATGNLYRRVQRTIERPVTQIQNERRERTIYRPEVVSELRAHHRTVYSPVVQYEWEARWQDWWNPFTPPTLAYQYVPRTRWQARSETVHHPHTETKWVAEKQIDSVPRRITQIQREAVVQYELVHGGPAASVANEAIAARLQATQVPTQLASAPNALRSVPSRPSRPSTVPVATYAADRSDRDATQAGMRPSVLQPGTPPPLGGVNIATAPAMNWLR